MRLDQRLRLLRGQAAPASPTGGVAGDRPDRQPTEPPAGDRPALSQRLRRLSTTTRRTPLRREPDESALAAELGGQILQRGVLLAERRLSLSARQGRFAPADCPRALPELADGPAGTPETWRFLDTETSGLAGGTGTWAFLTGLAQIRGRSLVLRQYLLTRLDAESDYLAAVAAELEGAALLVTFNGKTFDAPLLDTRLRLAGMGQGIGAMPHLDLLHPLRRAFAGVWPDCRLVTAEQRLLGLRRDGDLPGSEAPAAWIGWMREGAKLPLARVLQHNRSDLVSLPALATALAWAHRDPGAAGADVRAVARHHVRRGEPAAALALLARARPRLDTGGLLELARLHRRYGQWEEALDIWEPLAEGGERAALEALAKYLEHRVRDYGRALSLARRLESGEARERRCRRLALKLQGDERAVAGIRNR